MIILRSRSLIIPTDEYNLGNDYDTNTATRVFQLDRVMEGIDLANLMFKLDLTYADGTSDTLALDSEVTDDKINLTWTVTKNQLHVPGTVVVQIRALNVDGNMKWTSYIGAFFVEASMFGSADYNGKLSEVEQFEVAIKSEKERVQNEKVRQDAEAERVQAEAERKSSEEERETAEAERKSAETVRSKAETARESAETEREEWYNSAKTNFDAAIASGDKAERIANSLETNVEANMKAAAASATAAAGSASAAAGSANEAKEYSQNWSALDQKVTKNANDIAATNNNLSKKLFVKIGDTSNGNHSQIDQIADFYGITWVNSNYNSTFGGQWCFIDSTIIDNSGPYAMQRIMSCENAAVLATRYCTKGTWGAWNVGVTKSEIKVTNYFDRIKPDSAYINGYNNNEQCVKLIEISDNIKIVNINLAVKTKALNKIEAQIIELPAQIRPQKNVVFTAYANKEPAFAYYSSGKIMFIYNKALTENAEIDIIASYLI